MDEARSLTYSVNVKAETSQAESGLRSLVSDIGNVSGSHNMNVRADTSQAESGLRNVVSGLGNASSQADSLGSAFRKSFLAATDSENSFSSSLKSGLGGAFDYAKNQATDFKDKVVTGAKNIKDGFTHPIDTIKTGLGGAIKSAQDKFTGMVRSAEDATAATDDLGSAADGAQDDVRDLGDAAEESGKKFGSLSTIIKGAVAAVAAASVAVGGFAAASVGVGMEFDKSMSQVAATMGVTMEELNSNVGSVDTSFGHFEGTLRDFAQYMGSNTAFSATQAADALNYMALAGYDADTSMAMLPNVLSLAAAGNIQLAAASDMVTDAQSALGLTLEETTVMVDQMAMASSKSNTSVAQLGEAFLTIGGTAKNLAGGTTELATALGILADNGVKGSEGGTALRNVVLSLSAPTDKAAETLKKLGVQAFDAEGNMRPLNETFGDLNAALGNLTQEEQTQALNTIFNKNDLKSVNALLGTTAERWDELGAAIGDAGGAAAQMADTQLDNLAGDITLFKSALEGAQITISDELTPTLREFTQFGTSAITTIADAFKEGGLSGAMGALGTVLSEGLSMIIGKLPALIDAGMQLLGALGQGILDNLPLLVSAAAQIIVTVASGIGDSLPTLIPTIVSTVLLIGRTLLDNLPLILEAGGKIIGGLSQGIIAALPLLVDQLPELILQIVGFVADNLPTIAEQGIEILSSLGNGIIEAIPQLVERLPEIISSITGFIGENLPTILDQGVQLLVNLGMGIIGAIPQLVGQLPQIVTNIVGFITDNLPLLVEAGIQLTVQLAVGIIQAIPQLVGQLPQLVGAILGGLAELPGMMLDIGKNIVTGLWDGISSMASWIGDKISGFFGGIVDGAKNLLGIHSPSTVFADEIGVNSALGVGEGFTTAMGKVSDEMQDAIPTELNLPAVNGDVSVNPVMGDFNPPDLGGQVLQVIGIAPEAMRLLAQGPVLASVEGPEQVSDLPEAGSGETPPPGGNDAPPPPSTFAPVITIQVQGGASEESIENMTEALRATVRQLYDEFREEELERMALKNQYSFG